MSTRANIVVRNGDKGCDRLLYHHHDGDEVGYLLQQFVKDIITGDANDYTDFIKGYTNKKIGYYANEFKDETVISTDIDYIYYVSIFEGGKKKVIEGFKFPHPAVSNTGYGSIASDDPWNGYKIYDLFRTARDFTEERIRKYWHMSFYYVHGILEDEPGGGPAPKRQEDK